MKKSLLSLFVLFFLITACKEEEEPITYCGVENPAESLTWLNTLTDELNDSYFGVYFYVTAGKYQNEEVFLIRNCCPNCNTIISVYACDGEVLGFLGRDGAGIDPTEIKDEVIIWRGTGFECTV
ncbi:hypothetical protein [Algoriphagus marinus]|uniref:hypothetical protein n=1 Tax=Algoriphagus marinus TaxID=1925762 RepID=UPI00094BB2D0|nr:hypothetical protein [Algoriphagus marinus]